MAHKLGLKLLSGNRCTPKKPTKVPLTLDGIYVFLRIVFHVVLSSLPPFGGYLLQLHLLR